MIEVEMLDDLRPGDRLARREVHARYGGRQQGGISPSRLAPAVMFFTDPDTGHKHGYYDGVDDDGLFEYVGEGQKGDQQFTQGNRAIRDHAAEGRTLEGFRSTGTSATYLGEFELVDTFFRDAHETGDVSTMRQVIVFRLRPLNSIPAGLLPQAPVTPKAVSMVTTVPVEEQHTERSFVTPDREPYEIERLEGALVNRYRRYLQQQGHVVSYSDLWDETTRELIEAKGSVTRDSMRHAVGQLLDYGRFVEAASRIVLVPTEPRADLLSYLAAVGVRVVYPDGDRWLFARELPKGGTHGS
jgi:hypothetical protein